MPEEITNFQIIQSQFLCCFPVKKINWQVNYFYSRKSTFFNNNFFNSLKKTLQNLSWEQQEQFIESTVKLPELEKYPLNSKYVIRFLRYIIDELESQNLEVHDKFYTILCEYQSQSESSTSLYSFKHYRIEIDNKISNVILKENNNKISEGTTGLNVWESALVLSEWAIENRSHLREKSILELGAGTGLTSLVLGKCCKANSIISTDGNDKVLKILNENFSNNFERKENCKFLCENSKTKMGKYMQ